MEKKKLLFVINQFFKGGAETALLNLFQILPAGQYEIDFLVFDQIDLPGTISLIPRVPDWIRTVDVAHGEARGAFLKKAWFRLCRRLTHRQLFRKAAMDYLGSRQYDAAISYGEWFSSRLVAEYAQARRKYVWVHADMDKAAFVHPDIIRYQQNFDRFIFVSKYSLACAQEQYAFLRDRSAVVHNLVAEERLRTLSAETPECSLPEDGLPILLTVANIRPEKNHLRQIRVMERLFREGKRFYWVNVGTLANFELVSRVKAAAREAGLEEYFLLPGAIDNPYPLMKRAEAVCVLSDHESWSMVITEAKTLDAPVIATRTSGALEQLEDGKTGLLCDFTEEDIAKTVRSYLEEPEIGRRIRSNLEGFSSSSDTLERLTPLLQDERRKILYLFDDVNYVSGARNAALEQMRYLSTEAQMELFSIEPCRDESLRERFRTIDMGGTSRGKGVQCLSTPCREVIKGNEYSWKWKCVRAAYALLARLGKEQLLLQLLFTQTLETVLNGYDAVCVVSEASKLRGVVSRLEGPKKIQWIHTDYAAWREQTAWTRAITKEDEKIYGRFDAVVCLSENLREKFVRIYPQLNQKVVVIPNFIQYDRIQELSMELPDVEVERGTLNLITVGRMEKEKRYDLVLKTAKDLDSRGIPFHWYLVGSGALLDELAAMSRQLGLTEIVTFTGSMSNPYSLMKLCDALVLLSDYEGTPVTIDEAKVLGLPVLARDVGGIRDQLEEGKYGTIISEPFAEIEGLAVKYRMTPHTFTKSECNAHQHKIARNLYRLFF